MALQIPGVKNIFPHSREYEQGGGNVRPGQATVIVALDGTGDAATIQEGIDILPSTGGEVFIKEGIHIITTEIIIPSATIKLRGTGPSSIIQTTATINIVNIVNVADSTIQDLAFVGAGSGSGTAVRTITENTTVLKCTFKDLDIGVLLAGGKANSVSNCNFSACDVGIRTSGSASYSKITDNYLTTCDEQGIDIATAYNIVHGNTIQSCGGTAINLTLASRFNSIDGNTITINTGSGIFVVNGGDRNIISNNVSEDNGAYGIRIDGVNCDGNVIIGNICRANTTAQISDAGTGTLPNGATGTTNLTLDDLNIIA